MWNNVLSGLVLENLETLKHYQTNNKGDSEPILNDITEFVTKVIKGLPWYYRFPIKVFVFTIGLCCLMMTGHNLNSLPSIRRSTFIRYIRLIPFYGILNEFVRSLAFLRLFDSLPFIQDVLRSPEFKKV